MFLNRISIKHDLFSESKQRPSAHGIVGKKTDNFNPKITVKQPVKNILRTFRPSTGAIFNANNVSQTGWLATTPYWHKNEHTRSDAHVLNKRRGKDLESKFKLGFNC